MQKRFFLRARRFVRVRLRTPTKQTTYENRWEKSRKSAIKLLRTMGLCDIIKMSWLAPCLICKSGGKRYGKYSHGSELPYNTPVSSDHAAGRSKDVQDIFERRNPLKSKGFRMGEDKYEIRYRRSAKCWKIHAVQRHHQRRNSGGQLCVLHDRSQCRRRAGAGRALGMAARSASSEEIHARRD